MPVTKRKERVSDEYNIEERLERQIHLHLKDLEDEPQMFASKDRLQTIQIVGMWLNRKYGWGEEPSAAVGASVRKYAGAFKTKPQVRERVGADEDID